MSRFDERRLDYKGVPDVGLTGEEYKAITTALPKLLRIPDDVLPEGDRVSTFIGGVEPLVTSQEQFAKGRVSRRGMIFRGVRLLGWAGAAIIGAANVDQALTAYEAIEQWNASRQERDRQEQARLAQEAENKRLAIEEEKKQKQREYDIGLETNKQLGTAGTTLSKVNARMKYPTPMENVVYGIPVDNPSFFEVTNGQEIIIKTNSGNSIPTQIYINDFVRPSDGIIVPKLTVKRTITVTPAQNNTPAVTRDEDDDWILRNQKLPDIETNVIVVDTIENNKPISRSFQLNRTTTRSAAVYQFSGQERIYKPQPHP
jgi:hypothetical protein